MEIIKWGVKMLTVATKENRTMGISKHKIYDIYYLKDRSLVTTINNTEDEIVITANHFKEV